MKTKEEKSQIAQIVKKITCFLKERDWNKYHHPKEMASAIAVEYMELLECFSTDSSFSQTDLEDEIGDVYFGLASLYNCLHMEEIETLSFPPLTPSALPPLQLLLHFGVKLGRLMEHFQWLPEEESRSMKADADLISSYVACYVAFRLFCNSVNVNPMNAFFTKIEKTAAKYPAEKVSTDRSKYVNWKKQIKLGTAVCLIGGIVSLQANEFGSWKSPITAKTLVEGVVRYAEIEVDGDELYWLEARPEEKGRQVFVRNSDERDLYNAPFSARTTVHEYGGKCGAILNGVLYFSNYSDQHLYKVENGQEPILITDLENMRFADFSIHPTGNWLYAVGEDHTNFPHIENLIVRVDLKTGEVAKIATGHDFYSSPRVSPDGTKLCFYLWDHPNMPWDGTELWVANLDDTGFIIKTVKIAGGPEESVIEPSWSPDGVLYYVSDRNNYWNLYDETGDPLLEMEAEFASPPWIFGSINHAFITIDGSLYIAATITEKGQDSLVLIDRETKTLKRISLEFNFLSDIHSYKDGVVFLASSPFLPVRMVYFNPKTEICTVLRVTKEYDIPHDYISAPIPLTFPTEGNKEAYAFYYPPKNPNYSIEISDKKPPLIVSCHGGPTAHVSPRFALIIQYWTSRGFAVCDVNYGGSTGYGREYRNRLRGSWGVVDVEDCSNAAKYLIKKGFVDPERIAIKGGSAGGFTTLACLASTSIFQAGTDLFGVSDLIGLTECTHKFESRYNDTLVGPYPQDKEKYIRYSPVHNVNKISAPVLILQGDEDKIVPPSQSETVYDALLKNGIPTAYIVYKGEQHGFRKAENIIHSLESELYFYCKVFGFPDPIGIPSIKIENLKTGKS